VQKCLKTFKLKEKLLWKFLWKYEGFSQKNFRFVHKVLKHNPRFINEQELLTACPQIIPLFIVD